jgi:hypothetical protein
VKRDRLQLAQSWTVKLRGHTQPNCQRSNKNPRPDQRPRGDAVQGSVILGLAGRVSTDPRRNFCRIPLRQPLRIPRTGIKRGPVLGVGRFGAHHGTGLSTLYPLKASPTVFSTDAAFKVQFDGWCLLSTSMYGKPPTQVRHRRQKNFCFLPASAQNPDPLKNLTGFPRRTRPPKLTDTRFKHAESPGAIEKLIRAPA